MARTRAFALNQGPTMSGYKQIGNIAISNVSQSGLTSSVKWWNGPDENLGYVICGDNLAANQPTPEGGTASIQFWRSAASTTASYISLAQYISRLEGSPQSFDFATQATTWLNSVGYWSSYSIYSVDSGTKNPELGNGGQIPFPASGWTQIINASADDTFTQVNLPFTFTFNGTGYTSFFPNSNFYITFGNGSNQYSGLGPSSPPYDKIFFGGKDNSWQRVSSYTLEDKYFRLRWEGNNSTSGTVGSPGIVYELTFFNPVYTNNENWIELLIGNNNMPGQGISGIYSTTTQLTGGQIVPANVGVDDLESYVFQGDSTGTTWIVHTGYHVGGTEY